MADISVDFENLRVSALRKAITVSVLIDKSVSDSDSFNESNNKSSKDNIENKKNLCNVDQAKISQHSQKKKSNSESPRSGISFSSKKILLENEKQRQENVRKAMDKRKQDMEESTQAIHQQIEAMKQILSLQKKQQKAAERERIEEEKRLAIQDEIQLHKEAQLHAQRIQGNNERALINLEREAEEQRRPANQRQELIQKLDPLWSTFRDRCRDLSVLSGLSKDRNAVSKILIPYSAKLHELNQQIEDINEVARSGDLTELEVTMAEYIVRQSEEVFDRCKADIAKIDELYEQEIAQRELSMQQAQIEEAAREQQIVENNLKIEENHDYHNSQQTQQILNQVEEQGLRQIPSNENVTNAVEVTDSPIVDTIVNNHRTNCLGLFITSKQFLDNHEENCRDFLQSPMTKKFQRDCKFALLNPLNTLSNSDISGQDLIERLDKISSLFQGRALPNINEFPHGPPYCKNILAKHIINLAGKSRNDQISHFPIASIIVSIWAEFPDLGDFLLAHFRTACPYITPVFLSKYEGQSDEEYYSLLGYKYVNGKVEKHENYLNRMYETMKIYASIIVMKLRRGNANLHPHGLRHAWKWLAAILNLEVRIDLIDAISTVILAMLQIAGNALWNAYPRQFPKLLIFIFNKYCPYFQSISGGPPSGPMETLKIFLHESLERRSIPAPVGQLPPNVW